MKRSKGFRTVSGSIVLVLMVGLGVMGSAFAQDSPQLVGQVAAGSPIEGMIVAGGHPFVFADETIMRVDASDAISSVIALKDVVSFIGLEQDSIIGISRPHYKTFDGFVFSFVDNGGATFSLVTKTASGDSGIVPSYLMGDGSATFLFGELDRDNLLLRVAPDGRITTLSFSGLETIVPGIETAIWTDQGDGTFRSTVGDGTGELTYTGWFDDAGMFNITGVIEYEDGNDLILVKSDFTEEIWIDPRPLSSVINLSVGWDPRSSVQVIPQASGGAIFIATAQDGTQYAFVYDAVGNTVVDHVLPSRSDNTASPIGAFMSQKSVILMIPSDEANSSWQLFDVIPDPDVGDMPTGPIRFQPFGAGPPDQVVLRPNVFMVRGGSGDAYFAVEDENGLLSIVYLDAMTGASARFDIPVPIAFPNLGIIGPDGELIVYVRYEDAGRIMKLQPDGTSSILLEEEGMFFQEVSGLAFDANGLLYVADRSGTVSVYDY